VADTALHYAMIRGNAELVKVLADYKAEINSANQVS
jgi:ankyrin repeat protein